MLARANQKSLDIGIVGESIAGCFAATNAIHLREALDDHDDVDTALAVWDAGETAVAAELIELGRQYEHAFMSDPPEFTTMSTSDADAWWRRSVRHPEGFTFEAGPADELAAVWGPPGGR